jgi:two-component system chemotaxis response regulator CheY
MTVSEIRILVADDQRHIRNNLKTILEAAGHTVDTTGDSAEALARCHRTNYDIAFVDMNMQKIAGTDLVPYIRVLREQTTLVTLSQRGSLIKVIEAMKLGMIDFVEKPFDGKKVQLLCEEILRRRQLANNETVNELLHLAERALEQNTDMDARAYLKLAMLRDGDRPEPYYWLSELCENRGEVREALHYYCRAIDAGPTIEPTRKALGRLKQLAAGTSG